MESAHRLFAALRPRVIAAVRAILGSTAYWSPGRWEETNLEHHGAANSWSTGYRLPRWHRSSRQHLPQPILCHLVARTPAPPASHSCKLSELDLMGSLWPLHGDPKLGSRPNVSFTNRIPSELCDGYPPVTSPPPERHPHRIPCRQTQTCARSQETNSPLRNADTSRLRNRA